MVSTTFCTALDKVARKEDRTAEVSVLLDRLGECGKFLFSSGITPTPLSNQMVKSLEDLCSNPVESIRMRAVQFLAMTCQDDSNLIGILSNVIGRSENVVELVCAAIRGVGNYMSGL